MHVSRDEAVSPPETVAVSEAPRPVPMNPIFDFAVNHMFPSAPAVMLLGLAFARGLAYSVMTPAGVIEPILFPVLSVNHILPSGPAAIERGYEAGVGTGKLSTTPVVVIRPILLPL